LKRYGRIENQFKSGPDLEIQLQIRSDFSTM
jgi:hypothetical protein